MNFCTFDFLRLLRNSTAMTLCFLSAASSMNEEWEDDSHLVYSSASKSQYELFQDELKSLEALPLDYYDESQRVTALKRMEKLRFDLAQQSVSPSTPSMVINPSSSVRYSVDEELSKLRAIPQHTIPNEGIDTLFEKMSRLQAAQEKGITHYRSEEQLIRLIGSVSDSQEDEFKRKWISVLSRHPQAASLFTSLGEKVVDDATPEEFSSSRPGPKPLSIPKVFMSSNINNSNSSSQQSPVSNPKSLSIPKVFMSSNINNSNSFSQQSPVSNPKSLSIPKVFMSSSTNNSNAPSQQLPALEPKPLTIPVMFTSSSQSPTSQPLSLQPSVPNPKSILCDETSALTSMVQRERLEEEEVREKTENSSHRVVVAPSIESLENREISQQLQRVLSYMETTYGMQSWNLDELRRKIILQKAQEIVLRTKCLPDSGPIKAAYEELFEAHQVISQELLKAFNYIASTYKKTPYPNLTAEQKERLLQKAKEIVLETKCKPDTGPIKAAYNELFGEKS